MNLKIQSFNPLRILQNHHETMVQQIEEEANGGALSLPQPAVWVERMTQIMLLGITATGIWSVVARVDVVVAARGKLEPISQTQVVQSRVGGVVTSVMVREGETVKKGQLLMQLDKTPLYDQLETLSEQRGQMIQEVAALRMARQGEFTIATGELPPELKNQIQERSLLVSQLSGSPAGLAPDQQQRYALFQQQLNNQLSINQLQTSNLNAQIAATNSQAAQTEYQLQVEQGLLDKLQPLAESGAIARADVMKRVVDVSALQSRINQANLQKSQLQLSQQQAQVETQRVQATAYQDVQQQLASLDTQVDTTVKTNERQLLQIAAQLKQIQHDLESQDLRAPVNGIVVNLVHKLPGVVAQPAQVLLQVVPSESLIARIQVANADIANLQEGMTVDVRIDAYPFTEFGAVKGTVTKISREALPATPQAPGQTVFPIEVKLKTQSLNRQGKPLSLVPGMTVGANIKVRSRAPISYVADELIKAWDSLRSTR
ncbi:MAG: HlyD family type I secretion periplasmic adaptor subunit [Leptolyngbyaceae cyanobacterium CSU_1_4]|nr:HlyD family type I secretion periplasmic adaptor subunit [Leptolyngbyaceae cyanobacterium CSU_1_4]